ncbi:MAG: hypothetical protein WCJ49_09145, partial [Deltaproteobacteria bacterium]
SPQCTNFLEQQYILNGYKKYLSSKWGITATNLRNGRIHDNILSMFNSCIEGKIIMRINTSEDQIFTYNRRIGWLVDVLFPEVYLPYWLAIIHLVIHCSCDNRQALANWRIAGPIVLTPPIIKLQDRKHQTKEEKEQQKDSAIALALLLWRPPLQEQQLREYLQELTDKHIF